MPKTSEICWRFSIGARGEGPPLFRRSIQAFAEENEQDEKENQIIREVKNIDINKYLSTTFYDPSPHRFSENEKPVSERTLPVVYTCENCDYSISFKTDDFKKHNELNHSNLELTDKKVIDKTS